MKNSLLIALLGLTVTVAAPSVASADSDKKFVSSKNYKSSHGHKKQENRNVRKHNYRHNTKTVVKVKPRHHKPRSHNHKSKPSITVAWSTVSPQITYTNVHTYKNKHRTYNKPRRSVSIHDRQKRQHKKINKGMRSGHLIKHEAQQLRQEQHRIDKKIAKYQRDGRLNRQERAKIHKKLDVSSNNIRRKMNNRVTRHSQPRYEYARR